MAREKPGQTLQPTALVHEAYLRLVGHGKERHWDNRGHFFAAAAEAMRRILVDNARRKQRVKHGGGRQRIDLDEAYSARHAARRRSALALDEALNRLEAARSRRAELVKLRYFAGLTMPEAAEILGISLTDRRTELERTPEPGCTPS